MRLPNFGPELDELFRGLLEGYCWVGIVNVLYCIHEDRSVLIDPEMIRMLTNSKNPIVQKEANLILQIEQKETSRECTIGDSVLT